MFYHVFMTLIQRIVELCNFLAYDEYNAFRTWNE